MFGWHHRNNEPEFEQTLGNTEGQASLAGYSSWSSRVRHELVTEQQQHTQRDSKRSLQSAHSFARSNS